MRLWIWEVGQFNIFIIMKQHQSGQNIISGWANQNQINQDAIVLTNILQRKSKIKPLPHLDTNKTKQQNIHSKQMSNSKLGETLHKFYHKSNELLKVRRQKTEIFHQPNIDDGPILQKWQRPKKFAAITQQKEQPLSLSPFLNNHKHMDNINLQKPPITPDKISPFYKYQKWNQQKNFFSKTMKLNKYNTKSHQFIIHKVSSKFEKMGSKQSLKPNNLQIGNLKLRSKSRRNMDQKDCLSEERQIVMSNSRNNHSRFDISANKNTKYKNILGKREILSRNISTKDQIEFSDQVIFSNNSITINKQFLCNPYLQSKIQIIKQPQRYPQIFNK